MCYRVGRSFNEGVVLKKYTAILILAISISSFLYPQSLTSVILPKYIEGNTGINSNRIPYAYRARIAGLVPNSIYRFYNQVVISSDSDTSNGSGNCIFAMATGNFFRTSSPDLTTIGDYDSIATDGTGAYEGWFITEPTGSKRFIPGHYIFMRIILNDGAGGSTAATRLTTSDSVCVVKLDVAVTDSTGTGLRCTSPVNPKDFIFTYDNKSGADRPISGSFIENDGTDNSSANNYSAFYANQVNGIDGSFGVVLPNVLPNGIRRIERRSLASGALIVNATDDNGIWPSGANTINPSGGIAEIVLAETDVQWSTSVQDAITRPAEFTLSQNYPNPFNPTTVINYQIPVSSHVLIKVFDVLGREVKIILNEVKEAGSHSISFDASALSSGVYFYKMSTSTFVQSRQMVLMR
jgi:hypothetical protein